MGVFGCWRSGEQHTWCSNNHTSVSLEDRLAIKQVLHAAKETAKKAAQSRAQYAAIVVQSAEPAKGCHPYVKSKGDISVKGAKWKSSIPCAEFFDNPESKGSLDDVLLIPLEDKDGSVVSLQAITGNGSKFFMTGGTTKGGMFKFEGDTDTVYIAEGFATAATVYDATGKTVVCAFNANNLLVVAPIVKELFPDSKVIVAADNDAAKEAEGKGNKGKETAEKLFEKEDLPYSMPTFQSPSEGTDWNDFAIKHGNGAVAKVMNENIIEPRKPINLFEEAIECLRTDPDDAWAFDQAIKRIIEAKTLFKSRHMKELKKLTGVTFKDMYAHISEIQAAENTDGLSHGDIARELVKKCGDTEMVGAYGSMWTYQESAGVWVEKTLSKLGTEVSLRFNTQDLCQRVPDYKSISGFAYDLQEEQDFFEEAPCGVNTPSGFLCIKGSTIILEEANPLHRARHRLTFNPAAKGTEAKSFQKMLSEAFAGCHSDEQVRQLRMCFGLSLFGVMPMLQLAIMLFGQAGSGKSVLLKVLANMLPDTAVASVSPMFMDDAYQRAALAGKRFNLVPELDKDKPIPSADFKSIIGGDKISAREPYGKVFTYTPRATNWFNGNFFPKTTDHSEGFYRRWAIFHFNNTKPASERDPSLLERIVAEELPAILSWAIEGVEDYLANGIYLSPAHSECLVKWKAEGNSVQGWLNDHDDNYIELRGDGNMKKPLKVSEGYGLYRDWCIRCGVRAYKKATFMQQMEALGNADSLYGGYRVFSGLTSRTATILGIKAA
ncbi:hypothetical protein BCT27_01770 [Enterovibrio norvegicus]|nr:hypothetical protein BCT27_01770 [Enterovibrio norvegicus]